jgi:hypothetical protein
LLAQSPSIGIKVSFAGTPSHLKKEHTTSRGGLVTDVKTTPFV